MPISPQQCKAHFDSEDAIKLEQVQKYIDDYLLKHYHGQNKIDFSIQYINDRVQEKVKANYKQAGWNMVRFVAIQDQREGNYMNITLQESIPYER